MPYTKQSWVDAPSTTTPLSATRLSYMEQGIFDAVGTAEGAASTASTAAGNASAAATSASNAATSASNANSSASAAAASAAAAASSSSSASSSAATAASNAGNALDIAGSKNKVTTGSSAPSTPTLNDLWVDTGNGNMIKVWNSSSWVEYKAGSAAISGVAATVISGTLVAGQIATGAIVAEKIGTDAVESDKIKANAITATKIATDAVIADKIQANAITAVKIATDAVEADKIKANAITAGKIHVDAMTAKNYYSDAGGLSRLVIGPSFKFSGSDPAIYWDLDGSGTYSTTEPRIHANSTHLAVTMGTNKSNLDLTTSGVTIAAGTTGAGLNCNGTYTELTGPSSTAGVMIGASTFAITGTVSSTGSIQSGASLGGELLKTVANSTIPNVNVGSSGILAKTSHGNSSIRYKENVTGIDEVAGLEPERLLDIPICSFTFKPDVLAESDQRYGVPVPGMIAEEVQAHYPIAVDLNEDGLAQTWSERYLIPPMLALIQQQAKQIADLTRRVEALES